MKLIVDKNYNTRAVRVYLEEKQGSDYIVIGQKDGKLTQQKTNFIETPDLNPLLELPSHLFDDFVKLIVDYANNEGIKSDNHNLIEGKLQATENHLEDLKKYFPMVLDKLLEIK